MTAMTAEIPLADSLFSIEAVSEDCLKLPNNLTAESADSCRHAGFKCVLFNAHIIVVQPILSFTSHCLWYSHSWLFVTPFIPLEVSAWLNSGVGWAGREQVY